MSGGISRVGATGVGTAAGFSGSAITVGAGEDSGIPADGALDVGAETRGAGSGTGGARIVSVTAPMEGRDNDVTPPLSTLSLEDQVRGYVPGVTAAEAVRFT